MYELNLSVSWFRLIVSTQKCYPRRGVGCILSAECVDDDIVSVSVSMTVSL